MNKTERKLPASKLQVGFRVGWLAALLLPSAVFGAEPLHQENSRGMPASQALAHMAVMTDSELEQTSGQALFNMSYLAPGDANNFYSSGNGNIGFYKLGIEGDLEINANIRKLQLGCGGINGAGGCDIDIDNFSLSGGACTNANGTDCSTREGRVSSDAILSNPFLQLAIKNPNTPATREIVGFRVSAEQVIGLLTFGDANSNTPNGINSLSGYMKVQSDSSGLIKGRAYTNQTYFNAATYQVNGRLQALGLGGAAEATFRTSGGGFYIPAMCSSTFTGACSLQFSAPGVTVNGSRVTGIGGGANNPPPVLATLNIPNIYLTPDGPAGNPNGVYNPNAVPPRVDTKGGLVQATVTSCSWAACAIAQEGDVFNQVLMDGSIVNARANVTFTESLGFIHNLPINSPFYLSLQQAATKWPGTAAEDIAQRGWWMSFADPVNLGSVNPADPVDITPLFSQIATEVSNYLQEHPATTNDLGGLLGSGSLTVGIGTVNLAGNPLSLPLTNLRLAGQGFAPNCYGASNFC